MSVSASGWGTGGWGAGFWGGGGDSEDVGDDSLKNLSFEDAGATPGEAAFWSHFSYDPAGVYAAWGALYGAEDFETWAEDNSPLTDPMTDPAPFEILEDGGSGITAPRESMDSGWPGTDTFTAQVENSEDAVFGDDAQTFDGFENSWLSAAFVEEVLASTSAPDEDFETGWGNDPYVTDVTAAPAGPLTAAEFGTEFGPVTYENFEGVREAVMATADAATDRLYVESHSFPAGSKVRLEFTGLPPQGLQAMRDYFVNPLSATILQLLNADSSVVSILDDGAGTIRILPDPDLFWYDVL